MKRTFCLLFAFVSLSISAQTTGPLPKDVFGKASPRYQSLETMSAALIESGVLMRELAGGQIIDFSYRFEGNNLLKPLQSEMPEQVCAQSINKRPSTLYRNLRADGRAYLLPQGGPWVDFNLQIDESIAVLKKSLSAEINWADLVGKGICNSYLESNWRDPNAAQIPTDQRYIDPRFAVAELCEIRKSWLSGGKPSICHFLVIKPTVLMPAVTYAIANSATLMANERQRRVAQEAQNDHAYQEYVRNLAEARTLQAPPPNRFLNELQTGQPFMCAEWNATDGNIRFSWLQDYLDKLAIMGKRQNNMTEGQITVLLWQTNKYCTKTKAATTGMAVALSLIELGL